MSQPTSHRLHDRLRVALAAALTAPASLLAAAARHAEWLQLALALLCIVAALCAVDWRLGIGTLGVLLLADYLHGRRQGSAR